MKINYAINPGGGPRPIRKKTHTTTDIIAEHKKNRKQWEKGIDRMIAYRKKHGLQ